MREYVSLAFSHPILDTVMADLANSCGSNDSDNGDDNDLASCLNPGQEDDPMYICLTVARLVAPIQPALVSTDLLVLSS